MDILTNLQEYGVIGAAFTIVLIILKYNGKQGWKESLGLSDREKFFHLFLQTLTITTIMQFTFLCLAYTNVHLMKKLKYVNICDETISHRLRNAVPFIGVSSV